MRRMRRRFGPGGVFLADDVDSPGHLTRTIGGPDDVLFVPLTEDQVL